MGERNTLSNCTIYENRGFGITISDPYGRYSEGNLISNNTIRDNEYHGIRCGDDHNRIIGNLIVNDTIDLDYWHTHTLGLAKSENYLEGNMIYNGSINTYGRNATLVNNSIISTGPGIRLIPHYYSYRGFKTLSNLYSNALIGCYISLDLYWYSAKYLLDISENNTIDGKPVYYRQGEDLTGTTIPSDGGEVIMIQCVNGTVSDLKIRSGGAYVIETTGFSIDNCTFDHPSFGVYTWECQNLLIADNLFDTVWEPLENVDLLSFYFDLFNDISDYKLWIGGSNNHLYRNSLKNSSILLLNPDRRQYIDQTNKVNGKKVYYYFDEQLEGPISSGDGGQIILSKISNAVISNQEFTHSTLPIDLYQSDNVMISNCSFDNITRSAIHLNDVHNTIISIERSNFTDCLIGIDLYDSKVTVIEECIFRRCPGSAIVAPYRTLIRNNIFVKNAQGIIHSTFDTYEGYNTITDNIFLDTESYALVMRGHDNLIYNNTFINNNWRWEELGNYDKQAIVTYGHTMFYDDLSRTGNYWSDHFSKDLNEDDRYDDPYMIIASVVDRYPLTYSPHLPSLSLSGFGTNMEILFNWSWNVEVKWPMVATYIILYRNVSDNFSPITSFRPEKDGGQDNNPPSLDEMGYFVRIHATAVTGYYNIPGPRSNIINCSMDVTKPHLRIISPVEDLVQYENEVLFQWEGWDNKSGLTHFEIRLDGGEWEDVGLSTSRSYTDLSDGHHSFSVGCWDHATNYIAMSAHITIDRSGPDIEIYSPREGAYIDETAVTLKCRIIDRDTPISLINIYLDGELYWNMKDWSNILIGPLSEGDHYITVEAFDEFGNMNRETNYFTVDLTKPNINIESPYEGEILLEDAVEITWTVPESERPNKGYSIRLDEGTWYQVVDGENFTFGMLTEGHHTVEVSVKDLAGNTNYSVVNFWVQLTPITLDIQKPLEGSFLNNDTVHVSWISEIVIPSAYYLVRLDDSGWIEVWNSHHILTNLSDGDHSISIIMTDGVRDHAYGIVNFTVDTSPPKLTGIHPTGDDVEVTSGIWVIFDEPIYPGSLDIYVLSVPGEIERDGERYVHIRHFNLRYAVTYQVTIRCRDLLGNEMMPIMWTFKTVDRCWIRGEVLNMDLTPISGVEISVDGKLAGKTEKDGTYLVETTSGEHTIVLRFNDWEKTIELGSIDPGDTFNVPTIMMEGGEGEDSDDNRALLVIIMNILALIILLIVTIILIARVRRYRELSIEDEE